jgi:predicted nucleic acid-binding protein
MLVLDANILIRAVLGRRVRELLERYAVRGVRFLAPAAAFEEASKYLPMLLERRGIPRDDVLASLSELRAIVEAVEADFYRSIEQQAQQRSRGRDRSRLAHPRDSSRFGLWPLDRGPGLLWHWSRCMDDQPN